MNVFLKPFIGLNNFENDFRKKKKKKKPSDLINPNQWTQNKYFLFLS